MGKHTDADPQNVAPVFFRCAREGLSWEEDLQHQTAMDGRRRALIWTCPPALVTTTQEATRAGFERGVAWAAVRGLQTAVRATGGGAVLVGPGITSLALCFDVERVDLDVGYDALAIIVQRAVRPWGIQVTLSARPGAYCDGRHNLLAGGRKIAGTAQRIVTRRFTTVLAHSAILVRVQTAGLVSTLNDFYGAAFGGPSFDPGCSVALAELAGATADAAAFERAFVCALGREAVLWAEGKSDTLRRSIAVLQQ